MERLHALLHSLSRQQLKVLKKYLTSFSTRNEEETKYLDLALHILASEKKIPTLDECSYHIYGVRRDSRIEKLKTRLLNKVLDSLMIDINIERKEAMDESSQVLVRLTKKVALFQVLRLSSINSALTMQILDEIIFTARKYEFYPVLVDNLKYSKYLNGWKQGVKTFDKLNKQIEFYETCNRAVNRAMDNYYRMMMMISFYGKQDERNIQLFLRENLAEMKRDYEQTKSAVVGYYLKMLEMAYFQNEHNFRVARETCLEMLNIINNNISVYRRSRVGICYDNIAECDLHLAQYEMALSNIRSSQQHFVQKSSDYFTSKQLEFFALFYLERIAEARECCTVLLNSTSKQQGDFRVAKYAFFNACVQFKLGNYKEALTTLSMKFELSKDKLGWELAIRMLRIMTLIEMNKLDDAQPLVGSLQKHIERNARKGDVHQRDKMLARLFIEVEKEGFSFRHPNTAIMEMLELLSDSSSAVSWQTMSPELIPVHEWIAERFSIRLPSVHRPKEKESVTAKVIA